MYHRPARTDGLHNIVSTQSPRGRLWYHFLIQLISWIFMILSGTVMRAKAKVPLSICGWIRKKLSFSPSFITEYFWAHDWEGSTWSFARWPSHVKMWRMIKCLCVNLSFSLIFHCLSTQLVGPAANVELINQRQWDTKVMDSSINQLVTRRLLTHPRRQRGTCLPLL